MKSATESKDSTKKVRVQRLNSSSSSRAVTPNSSKASSTQKMWTSPSNTGYDQWTKKELVNYYTLKVAEYETEVDNQIQLLKKRKQLLEETKNIKSELYHLIEKRDLLTEQASKIEKEIEFLTNNNQ